MVHIFKDKTDSEKRSVLEQLYLEYRYLMFHIASEILQDDKLAEDAVHTVFVKLSNSSFKFDEIACNKTKAFMAIVVRNAAVDMYNKRKNEKIVHINDILDMPDEKPLPLEFVINNENITNMQKTLHSLEPKYADVVLMKYFYDYSDAEIALLFGISEQLVRVRLQRAKKKLISRMPKEDAYHEQERTE